MRSRLPLFLILALSLALVGCGFSRGALGILAPPPVNGPDAPTNLTYAKRIYILAIGEEAPAQVPTVGGIVEAYTIDPVLPAGMSFDGLTGEISGAPTEYMPHTAFEIVASNFDGTDHTAILIQVGGESRFAYGASSVDGSVAEFGVEPEAGKLFHQGWVSGQAPTLSQIVVDRAGRWLLTLDELGLSSWRIDPLNGRLTDVLRTGLGVGPHSIALHPSGAFVFVTTLGEDRLRTYSVDPQSGALTLISSVVTGSEPRQVLVDPLGRYLIVRHEFDTSTNNPRTPIRSYTIDSESGIPTESSTQGLFGVEIVEMTLDPLGESLYLALSLPLTEILHCSVDTQTGQPTAVGLHAAGALPSQLAVAPDGRRLYVINSGSNNISLFNISPENGGLTLDSQLAISAGLDALSFSFDGKELYLVNSAEQLLLAVSLNPTTGHFDGATSTRTRPGSLGLVHVAGEAGVARRATNLYVLNGGSQDLTAYSIDALSGALDDGGAIPIAAGVFPSDLVVDPRGRFVYASQRDSNEIIGYAIQPDGTLLDLLLPTFLASGAPVLLAIDPSGRFVFTIDASSHTVISFEVQPTGSLQVIDTQPMPDNPTAIAVDPTGRFLYVCIGGPAAALAGELRSFELGPLDGTLTPMLPFPTPGFPSSIAFNEEGTHAYVTLRDSDLVRAFAVNLDGSFSSVGIGTPTESLPGNITLSSDGRFAYAVFEDQFDQGGLLLYDVQPVSGELFDADTQLLQWRSSSAAGTDPFQVLLSPDARHVYVLAATSEQVLVLDADADTGLTTLLESQSPGLSPVRMGVLQVVE